MSHSQSFTKFMTSLGLAESLLNLESQYSDPPNIYDQQTVEGLRGGAVILMVAAFEYFLKSAIVEHLNKLIQPTKVPFSKLPKKMLVNNVYSILDHAMKGPPGTEKFERISDIQRACQDIISQTISPLYFSDTRSNPNSDNVKKMFFDIGKEDIFNLIKNDFDQEWKTPTHLKFIPEKLDEIVEHRHVVAHTANALNISRSDLESSIRFLKTLSSVLDSHIEKHVEQIRI